MGSLSVAQPVIEKFVRAVCAQDSHIYLAASFLPWNDDFVFQPDAERVLFPTLGSEMFAEDVLEQKMAGKEAVVIACTFNNLEEEIAARRMLPQLARFQDVCKVVMHVLPEGRPNLESIKAAYDRFFELGADDIIMEPDWNMPRSLGAAIQVSVASLETTAVRFQYMLRESPLSPVKIKEVQAQHQRLLWDSIPRCLMPQFPLIDNSLEQKPGWVSHYRLGEKLSSPKVMQAFDTSQDDQRVAIKVLDKGSILTANEVEGVYRELRLLTEILNHPNVVRGLCILHAKRHLYFVLVFAGLHNLEVLLRNLPGQRLQPVKVLEVFKQAVTGMAYCHSKHVVHRDISLKHVVVQETEDGQYQIKFCDFQKAIVANRQFMSRSRCGTLPYLAPEAVKEEHIPMVAECWSMGVLLLEMGGGLGTFFKAMGSTADIALESYKHEVSKCVTEECFHVRAWTCTGAEKNALGCEILMTLLIVEPELRGTMESVLQLVE